ncbi:MAG: ABC transporter permease, partial [Bacteroidales bacterium]|nr:ABC transporter permease [Bacteroidales bacterium]
YDRFNEKYDRIYRLYLEGRLNESEFKGAWTAAPTARVFLEELPEIEAAIRMTSYDETLVRIDDRKFIETEIALADSSFFDIFSIPLITGNPKEALASPNTVVLTESQAYKYFGDEMPVGKHLRLGNDTVLYTITGVMEDVPENSHFDFSMLISLLPLL